MIGKLIGSLFGIFFALAGPVALVWAGWWIALDRPAYHVGWCPFCVGWGPGAHAQLSAYQAAEKAAQARARTIEAHQAQITLSAAQHDATAQAAIQTRYRTIIREVHDVVTPAIDRSYPLSNGFVRLHDSAALGLDLSLIPASPGEPDDAASRVKPSDAGAQIAANYGDCRADAQQLADLQAWLRSEAAAQRP